MSLTLPSYLDDLALLVDKVKRVGALAQHLKTQGLIKQYKKDGSIVTNADLAVDLWLKEALIEARPSYGWHSEESPDSDERLSKARIFVLDPIDGTMGFSKGSPYWTIALAVVEDAKAVAAVIYAPDSNELYSAALGFGAKLNDAPIKASDTSQLEGSYTLGDARMFAHLDWPEVWPKMHIQSRPSVAYRMASIAAGKADFTMALTPKRDWDVAAATLICQESGAIVSDHLGNPYTFNGIDSLKPSLICSNKGLYAQIKERCQHLLTLHHLPIRPDLPKPTQ